MKKFYPIPAALLSAAIVIFILSKRRQKHAKNNLYL